MGLITKYKLYGVCVPILKLSIPCSHILNTIAVTIP